VGAAFPWIRCRCHPLTIRQHSPRPDGSGGLRHDGFPTTRLLARTTVGGTEMSAPKIWFVTGAARGFGRLWTEAALDRGDKVAATVRNLATLDGLVRKYGDAILPLKLDVTDRAGVF